jgi:hypothetical protein
MRRMSYEIREARARHESVPAAARKTGLAQVEVGNRMAKLIPGKFLFGRKRKDGVFDNGPEVCD